jgi:hypothetical protein
VPEEFFSVGAFYFVGVKLVGYILAAYFLRSRYRLSTISPIIAGVARTAMGIAAALLLGGYLGNQGQTSSFLEVLVPSRFAVWLAFLWLFYERRAGEEGAPLNGSRFLILAAAGTAWSFVLDLPAVVSALFLPGGMGFC